MHLLIAFKDVQGTAVGQKFINLPPFFVHSESRGDFIRLSVFTHPVSRFIGRISRVLFIIKRSIYS